MIRFTTNSVTRIAEATLKAGKMQHLKVNLMPGNDGRNWNGPQGTEDLQIASGIGLPASEDRVWSSRLMRGRKWA